MTEQKTTDRADLTGPGQLYDAERRYIAVTLTDELRTAVYDEVRRMTAAGTPTTGGLLLRDIVAAKLNVKIDVTRAPNGAPKSDAEKRNTAIHTKAHTAGLLAQHARAMADATYTVTLNDDVYTAAYNAKRDTLRAADAKKAQAADTAMSNADAKRDATAAADAQDAPPTA